MYMCVAPAGGNKRPADAPSGDAPPPKRLVDSAFPLDFVNLTGRWSTAHSGHYCTCSCIGLVKDYA